jgi:hypothetical protein
MGLCLMNRLDLCQVYVPHRQHVIEKSTYTIVTDSVRSSQETHYVTATKPNRLMLFRETVAVYCENHTEHADNTVWTECRVFVFAVEIGKGEGSGPPVTCAVSVYDPWTQ